MAYKAFKRVLVENNLERKCLLLFGVSLSLLISGAFWYAERNAEFLVEEKIKQTGRDFVDLSLLRHHVETITHLKEDELALIRELDRHLLTQDYEWEILVLDETTTIDRQFKKTRPPKNPYESEIVEDLRQELAEHSATLPPPGASSPPIPATDMPVDPPSVLAPPEPGGDAMADDVNPRLTILPVSRLDAPHGKYHYYQPVYWKDSCISCHESNKTEFIGDKTIRPELRGPLRVVKVTIPASQTQKAMTYSRAILATTAIVTVSLAMIVLYLVVRLIIIRPLNHLRDVSDEISRGNTNLRAEIQTNDEFEELAASFNRMLRHLVEAHEELRKLNVDLDEKLDELARANMQLHEMNRVKSDFLANMSHELRTPLNSIIGFSDVLRGIDALNAKQKRYVENIGNSGRVLLDMINDILDLAKMESGKMGVRVTQFDIERVVVAQCDLVRALAEEKNIDLKVQVASDLPPMQQDQGKVQQILTNLLSNAIKFTPEGGRIGVSVKQDEHEFLVLNVEDTGIGIAEEDRHIIFEKFRQGRVVHGDDNFTREFSGTGLGLSIVKELCKLLGGEVSFESELGKGSCFTVRLPWFRGELARSSSSLAARLDDVTSPTRVDARRMAGADGSELSDLPDDTLSRVPN
jgi:signal transduction histidine kinase